MNEFSDGLLLKQCKQNSDKFAEFLRIAEQLSTRLTSASQTSETPERPKTPASNMDLRQQSQMKNKQFLAQSTPMPKPTGMPRATPQPTVMPTVMPLPTVMQLKLSGIIPTPAMVNKTSANVNFNYILVKTRAK